MKRVLTLSKSDSILPISTKAKHFSGDERGTKKKTLTHSRENYFMLPIWSIYLFLDGLVIPCYTHEFVSLSITYQRYEYEKSGN